MASVGGSKSLQFASDALPDHICGPCKVGGDEKDSKHYCQDCSEYLCETCKDYHRKLVATKNHKIASGSNLPASRNRSYGFAIFCGCNKNEKVEFYCEEHGDVICNPCKTIKHHQCQTTSIRQKSSGYKSSTFNSVLAKAKTLKDKYERIKQESDSANEDLTHSKESCKNVIKAFREELNTILDKLEQDMVANLDKRENDVDRHIQEYMSTLTTALEMLDADCNLLEDAKISGKQEMMFTADILVSKNLQVYNSRLADLEKDSFETSISFERNKTLENLLANVRTLGSLTTESSPRKTTEKMPAFKTENWEARGMILDRNIESRSQVNVRLHEDKGKPFISGCAIMTGGYAVICDNNNDKIKLFDSSWVLTENLKFPCPWDVSVVDDSNVIVTSPDNNQLQYVQIFPHMAAGRVIQLDKECWGVHVCRDEIYTTCHDDQGNGEVRVLDVNGKLKRRLGVHQDGTCMFTMPYYITVNTSGEKVFISDVGTLIITCMKANGDVIHQYKAGDMRGPAGLYCDSGDNILVCGGLSHNVQEITSEGKKNRTLLSSSEGLHYSSSISYRESDDTLVIGCCGLDNLLVFKLMLGLHYVPGGHGSPVCPKRSAPWNFGHFLFC